jgi:hypothetical protein
MAGLTGGRAGRRQLQQHVVLRRLRRDMSAVEMEIGGVVAVEALGEGVLGAALGTQVEGQGWPGGGQQLEPDGHAASHWLSGIDGTGSWLTSRILSASPSPEVGVVARRTRSVAPGVDQVSWLLPGAEG